jgi:hypothetical protein
MFHTGFFLNALRPWTNSSGVFDIISPTAPTSLLAELASNEEDVELSWGASFDNVGIAYYQIFRNDAFIDTTTNLFYTEDPGYGTFTYKVRAIDTSGNPSAFSNTSTVQKLSLLAISGLINWLDAEKGVTTSGSFVDSWEDQSGNGAVVTNTGIARPSYNTDSFGAGQPGVEFDGSQWLFTTSLSASPDGATSGTLGIVYKTPAIATGIDPDFAYAWTSVATTALGFIMQPTGLIGTGLRTYRNPGPTFEDFFTSYHYGDDKIRVEIITFDFTLASDEVRHHMAALLEKCYSSAGTSLSLPTPSLIVGASSTAGDEKAIVDIGDVFTFDHALTDNEVATLYAYFADKYALTFYGPAIPSDRFLSGSVLTGLTNYWKLDETSSGATRVDSVGIRDLSPISSPFVIKTGKHGYAHLADGSSGYLRVDTTGTADLTLTASENSLTWCAWAKSFKVDEATARTLIMKQDSGGVSGSIEYWMYTGSGVFNFGIGAHGAVLVTHDITGITNQEWFFVVGWYDQPNSELALQINNGTPVTFDTSSFVVPGDTSKPFTVGAATGTIIWRNVIDEVGWWRRKLTDAERTFLWNDGFGRTYMT